MYGCLLVWIVAATPVEVNSVIISPIFDVQVASQETGQLMQVHVSAGDNVQQGDVLAELDDRDARHEVERIAQELQILMLQAEHSVRIELAEKALGVAEAELARAEESNRKYPDSVSQTELDRLRLTRDKARLEIEQARHDTHLDELRARLKQLELEMAKEHLARRRILAPIDGVITKINMQQGEWITAGEKYCRILRVDRVRAEGFASLNDAPLTVGMQAMVVAQIPGRGQIEFPAQVTFIDPEVQTLTGQYRIWAEVDNHENLLRPGISAKLLIPSGE